MDRVTTHHVIGGATLDIIVDGIERFPRPDGLDEFTAQSLVQLDRSPSVQVGGNAGNAAIVLQRLGSAVTLHAPLADDLFGHYLCTQFRGEGVSMSIFPAEETSVNIITTDLNGSRTSMFRPIAIATEPALATLSSLRFVAGGTLLIAGYPHPDVQAMQEWTRRARKAGAIVAIDIGPQVAGLLAEDLAAVMSEVDLLFANDAELTGFADGRDANAASEEIVRQFGVGVVRKQGADGAQFISRSTTATVRAVPVHGRSTVGAGDAFDAGFLWSWHADANPARALSTGAHVAAEVIRAGIGARGAPTGDAVLRKVPTTNRAMEEQ